ncbi:MAG TPA: hypothetical protein VFS81_18555 [Candidatus Binatia bacterium]|nr:hypothetical protein [Candidatus Binatia bacterium]
MLMEPHSLQSSTLRVGQKLKVLAQSLRGTLRWCETNTTLMIVADPSRGRGNVQ